MPYIDSRRRRAIDPQIEVRLIALRQQDNEEGVLNYTISRIVGAAWNTEQGYTTGNRLLGMLGCVAKEFYRRILVPYEDAARRKNGDVPEYMDPFRNDGAV